MTTAPTLPQFNGGSFTDQQGNGLVTGIAFAIRIVQMLANYATFTSIGGCTLSTTSASYGDIVNATTSWTKIGSSVDSDVLVNVALDVYSAGAGLTEGGIGINIGGTDYDICKEYNSSAGVIGGTHGGSVRIAGVNAGPFAPKLRGKRNSGAGTVTVDNLCNVSFFLTELPK